MAVRVCYPYPVFHVQNGTEIRMDVVFAEHNFIFFVKNVYFTETLLWRSAQEPQGRVLSLLRAATHLLSLVAPSCCIHMKCNYRVNSYWVKALLGCWADY